MPTPSAVNVAARHSSAANNGEFAVDEARDLSGHIEMEDEADRGGEQARADAAENAGDEHRRHQEEVERLAAEGRRQHGAQAQGEHDEAERERVDERIAL